MTLSLLLAKGGLFDPIAKPLAAVLAFFYSLVPNYGIAIVMLTIAMMIVLTPLTIKQTRSMLVMQKLQPEMKKLQEQHKNDRAALNEAVMALYKEHNASPLGGCLPMLLPFPLFIGLLRVLEGLSHIDGTTHQAIPKYLTSHTRMYQDIVKAHGQLDAFGMNLAKSARNVGGGFAHTLPYFVLLLVMVGTQFYQQYQLTSKNPAAKSQPGQAAMMKFIPIFFGIISLNFPAGVVLYWTVSNIIRIGQQWALYRYDPKVKALVVKDVKEIEAKTREIDARNAKPKPSARGRLRDLMSNASEAAADRKGLGGKNAAKPGSRPAGDKNAAANRGGTRTPPGKATPGTPGANKAGVNKGGAGTPGANKAGVNKGGAGTPGANKTGVNKLQRPGTAPTKASGAPKGPPPKPGGGSAKPNGAAGAAGAGSKPPLKPGAGRPGAPKPGAAPAAGRSGGDTKAGTPPKPGGPSPTATPKPLPAATSADGTDSPPVATPKVTPVEPTVATNGGGAPAAADGNGVAKADGTPTTPKSDNGGASKGRTGGGGARNVGSQRRRRGR